VDAAKYAASRDGVIGLDQIERLSDGRFEDLGLEPLEKGSTVIAEDTRSELPRVTDLELSSLHSSRP
jgi:hypothetical protein